MKFLDSTTGQTIDATEDQVSSLFLDPRYTPIGVQKFTLKDEEGQRWDFDSLDAARNAATQTGAQFITPFEDSKQTWEERGLVGDLAAAGLGAASTATFGLSDFAARALGKEEDVRAIREASPVATVAGEIAGALVPTPIAPFLSVGSWATKAGKKVAEKLGEGLASKTVAALARGGVAGAQQGVSQVALADTPVVSTQSAATLGMNVLLGAGLDAVFPLAGAFGGGVARKVIPGVNASSEGVANKIFAKGAAAFSGEDEKVIKTFLDKERRNQLNELRTNLVALAPTFRGLLTENTKAIKDSIGKAYGRLEVLSPELKEDWFGLERRALLEKSMNEARNNKNLPSGIRKNIGRAVDILQNEASDTKAVQESLSVLRTIKRSMNLPARDAESAILLEKDKKIVDDLIDLVVTQRSEAAPKASKQWTELDKLYAAQKRGEKLLKSLKTDESTLRGIKNGKLYRELDGYIREIDAVEPDFWRASESAITGAIEDTHAFLQQFRDYNNFMRATRVEKGPGVGTLGVGYYGGIGVAAVTAALSNPAKYLQMLDNTMQYGQQMLKFVDDVSKKQFFPTTLRSSPTLVSDEVGLAVYEALKQQQGYENHLTTLNSPESLERAGAQAESLSRLHPDLPATAINKLTTVQGYLAREVPKPRPALNGRRMIAPTDKELGAYAKKLSTAIDPLGTIERLGLGGLTALHLNTLKEVHPDIYTLVLEATNANMGVDLSGATMYQEMHTKSSQQPQQPKKALSVSLPKSNIQRASER